MAALRSPWTWAPRAGGMIPGEAMPSWIHKVNFLLLLGARERKTWQTGGTALLCVGLWLFKALSEWVLLAENCEQGPGQRGKSKLCPSLSPAGVRMVPTPGAEPETPLTVWTVTRPVLPGYGSGYATKLATVWAQCSAAFTCAPEGHQYWYRHPGTAIWLLSFTMCFCD